MVKCFQSPFHVSSAAALTTALALLVPACGEETPHEHDVDDFESRAECVAHYEAEDRSPDEVESLCEGTEE
jgi:hypothetical protein